MRIPLGLRAAAGATGPVGPSNPWDLNYLVTSAASTFTLQTGAWNGITFKPDGTKFYVVNQTTDVIRAYDLSSAWDVSTASLTQTLSVAGRENTVQDVFFKPDGTKVFIVGSFDDEVNEYALSTAWDISTASHTTFKNIAAQDNNMTGLYLKPDGTKMYTVGIQYDRVHEYNLSTAWDVSTASYSQFFSVASEDATPQAIFFRDDGTRMFVLGGTGDDINQYDLSTAWDISTASYSMDTASLGSAPTGMYFKPDGGMVVVLNNGNERISAYTIS